MTAWPGLLPQSVCSRSLLGATVHVLPWGSGCPGTLILLSAEELRTLRVGCRQWLVEKSAP